MREIIGEILSAAERIGLPSHNFHETRSIHPDIGTVIKMVGTANKNWVFRFEKSDQINRLQQAEGLAIHLNRTGLLEFDKYYTSLNPRQHHIAFNMLSPLIPSSQNIEDFMDGSPYCHTIVSYLKGITTRKQAISTTDNPPSNTHKAPSNTRLETGNGGFLTEFRLYFTKHSDYSNVTNDNLRAFFTHLITLPEFSFLKPPEEERDNGQKDIEHSLVPFGTLFNTGDK